MKNRGVFEGLEIKSPHVLEGYKDVKVIIASIFWEEMMKEAEKAGCWNVAIYKPVIEMQGFIDGTERELAQRTINLGAFLKEQDELLCREMTFTQGGSQILDYVFLKSIAERYHCMTYLEIGTYIGESINILTDCCERLYSVTAPIGAPYSMAAWCKHYNMPDYSERLAYSDKIIHYYTDSKLFDFTQIKDEVDLYFIDADHSYDGVYEDTKNVFSTKKEDAIVIWHDFRKAGFQYNVEVVRAVKDVLGEKFKNVYVTDHNMCGIYLPDACIKDFILHELKYEEDADLYTYDVMLENCQIK